MMIVVNAGESHLDIVPYVLHLHHHHYPKSRLNHPFLHVSRSFSMKIINQSSIKSMSQNDPARLLLGGLGLYHASGKSPLVASQKSNNNNSNNLYGWQSIHRFGLLTFLPIHLLQGTCDKRVPLPSSHHSTIIRLLYTHTHLASHPPPMYYI